MVATSLPESGTLLGRYRVLKHLGSGAGGAVFQAEDTLLGETVCLKLLHPAVSTHPELLGRFKREVLLARRATHRGICRVFDLHEEQGVLFVTMELVEGQTLRDLIVDKGRLGIDRALRVVASLSHALAAAHDAGVIHRDLKPRNIMIRPNEDACILDFGLATANDISNMTRPGVALGTLHYIAPEVWRGEPAQAKSDLYAVGVILFNCLTGRKPFASDGSVSSIPKWILTEGLAAPSQYAPDVPPEVDALFRQATAVDPADRIGSALELAKAAEACLERRSQRLAAVQFEDVATEPAQTIRADPQFDGETLPPFKDQVSGPAGPDDPTRVSGRPSVRPLPEPQPTVVMRRRPEDDPEEDHPTTSVPAIHVTVSQSDPDQTLLTGPPSSSGPGEPSPPPSSIAGGEPPPEGFDDDMSWVIGGHGDRLKTRIVKAPVVVSQEDVAQGAIKRRPTWPLAVLGGLAFLATLVGGVLWIIAAGDPGAPAATTASAPQDRGEVAPANLAAPSEPTEPEELDEPTGPMAPAEPTTSARPSDPPADQRAGLDDDHGGSPQPKGRRTLETHEGRRGPAKARSRAQADARTKEKAPKARARAGKPAPHRDDDGGYAASLVALKTTQARLGLRPDDVPGVAALLADARREAKAGQHERARAHVEEATRRMESTSVDRAFVERKLKRLKGQIAQVTDGPQRDQLVALTIEAVQRLGRSELELANQALNRGLALVDRAR